ncbi:MAG TPA: dihydroorotate dehydrogenase-like protein [Bacteroidales bacterium]|nr:dihydroorotate dehydrogenase-like protein [Bacteroidales bacterium]HSA42112.1 dihydroorotate dehydrogenase-like protein [Bacteroidales bacterium]
MASLSTTYMGLSLKSPLIAGSSGLTNTIDELREIAAKGAGAVVLKSIFEEQIRFETEKMIRQQEGIMDSMNKGYRDVLSSRPYDFAQAQDYIHNFAKEHTLADYLKFIEEAKKAVAIPVIASINCVSPYDWHYFARRIQSAGADAIELNIYVLPSNPEKSGQENENTFFEIVDAVRQQVTIPLSVKVSYYFSGLSRTLLDLSKTGIRGMVLFNRPFHPDLNIDTLEITSSNILSQPSEYSHTLRWIAILAGRAGCDLVASTGIHDYESVVKQILAGANAVQLASVLYKYGFDHISRINAELEKWMDSKAYRSLDDFRGKLSQVNVENPAVFERVQFMRLYSKIV